MTESRGTKPGAQACKTAKASSPIRSWFALTPAERRAVCLILALALLGLAARYWRSRAGLRTPAARESSPTPAMR